MDKSLILRILNLALIYVECCNEYNDDYLEEEKQYKELLWKIEDEDFQDFSKNDIEIIIDACENAINEIELNIPSDDDYDTEIRINNIVKFKQQLQNIYNENN